MWGILMSKIFMFFLSIIFLTLLSSEAAIYKGQRAYMKECINCHTDGQTFIKLKTISEWGHLLVERGKPLGDIHLKSIKTRKSWNYFMGKKYQKDSRHLKQFLMEYAKDSGKVAVIN